MHKHVVVALILGALFLPLSAVPSRAKDEAVGAVYTMTNDPAGNTVLVFDRAEDGSLTSGGTFSTGGGAQAAASPTLGSATPPPWN
jgi:hypothetical protein